MRRCSCSDLLRTVVLDALHCMQLKVHAGAVLGVYNVGSHVSQEVDHVWRMVSSRKMVGYRHLGMANLKNEDELRALCSEKKEMVEEGTALARSNKWQYVELNDRKMSNISFHEFFTKCLKMLYKIAFST